MIRLHLFGTLDLRDRRSNELRSVLAQPKRSALLAYLAACRPGTFHRRGALVAVFWPELDEAHARNALSKSLHHLRRSLGEAAVESRGQDEIGVSAQQVWCDVGAFLEAQDAGDHATAVALFSRGELLSGLTVPDAPGFDEWLEHERAALLRQALASTDALIDAAELAGDDQAALHWIRTAAQLARYDERVVRRLLVTLDRAGDRAGAVAAYAAFAERLARELDLEPSPETQSLAAEIRARSEPTTVPGTDRRAVPGSAPAPRGLDPRPEPPTGPTRSGGWRPNRLTTVGLIAAAGLSLLAILSTLVRPETRPTARFDVTPSAGQALVPGLPGIEFDLSPDGTRIVYVGESRDGRTQLWLRVLGDRDATPIAGTSGALSPAFSPDGQSVAFEAGGMIRTISLRGGAAAATLTAGREPAWSADGRTIYFARGIEPGSVIHRIAATGGEPEAIVEPAAYAFAHPRPLPGGRGVLVTTRPANGVPGSIAVIDLRRGGRVQILHAGAGVRYAPTGQLVWGMPNGALMTAPFDARRLEMTGPPVGLPETVLYKLGGTANFTLSASGTLLYQVGGRPMRELVWVSRAGGIEPVDPAWTGPFSSPALSPDGTHLSVSLLGPESADVWVKQLDRGPQRRLTLDGRQNTPSAWTPDGRSITFGSDREGVFRMWTKRADGSGELLRVLPPGVDGNRGRWSRDGQWLVYRPGYNTGDILAFRPGRDTVPVPIVATPAAERNPALSPDGRWLAYTSDETGSDEVYVVPFPDASGGKWRISNDGGLEPLWAHSGRELFYRTVRGEVVAVPIETQPTFSHGSPRVMFTDATLYTSTLHPQYDIAPGDQRFLMIRQVRGDDSGRVKLIQNFFDEIRRLTR